MANIGGGYKHSMDRNFYGIYINRPYNKPDEWSE